MKHLLLLLVCLIPFSRGNSQSLKTDSLLRAIAQLQEKQTDFYCMGMFAAERGKHKSKQDNTVFFTSLIAFTMQNTKSFLSEKNKKLDDSVCHYAIANYSFYKNQKGMNTYNFWQTRPEQHFPNSKFLSHKSHYTLPDDADCTALIYLTDTSFGNQNNWLKTQFSEHANGTTADIKNTFHKYRNNKAYSTWFGKKMPIEFDICVQSNMLYFVYENKLPINANDKETISLIKSMILSGEYLKYSYYVSPSYKKPSIVLYHLARLLGKFQIQELDECRNIIRKDIENELQKTNSFMEKVILSTSLLRMGEKPIPLVYPNNIEKETKDFIFFEADLFSSYARPSFKFISKSRIFAIPFHCKTYCLALLLEYEVLEKENQKL